MYEILQKVNSANRKGKEIHLTMVKEKCCSSKDITKIIKKKKATDQKIPKIHVTGRGLALII